MKLRKIENDYHLIYDLGLWRDIFLPLGTLLGIIGLYSYFKEIKKGSFLEKEIDPGEFHYAYSKLPEDKKSEKIKKFRKR